MANLTAPLVMAIALIVCPAVGSGDCPVPAPPCDSMRKADLVFYGEVLTAGQPQHGNQKVTFRVLRPFKGVSGGRFTGAFRVTSKSVHFVAGERRIVYASSQGGRWSTDCARSAFVLRASDQEVEDLASCVR